MEDSLALKLLDIYQNYIFEIDIENSEEIKIVEKLDFLLNKYLEDYFFRKDMNSRLLNIRVKKSSRNIIKNIVEGVIEAFESYEMGYTRNIYFARWI